MSKSIEDYRTIIKVLKLQLLKVREQNAELSHVLGIAAENETSSFTPRINHYAKATDRFAKNIIALLNFAHRCELIGVTPEMIFRIADKKRDKKISANNFGEILRRVKLHLSEVEVNQLLTLVTRGSPSLQYEEYLQCLSAFQVNSEKYPAASTRTYVQLCLLKFAKAAVEASYSDPDALFREMNAKQDSSYLPFENYATFVRRSLKSLEEFETVAVFVGLDLNSECQIEKSIFRREVAKALSIVERGVNAEDQLSAIKEASEVKQGKEGAKLIKGKSHKDAPQGKSESSKPKQSKQEEKPEDDLMSEQTGDQGAAKVKKASKKPANPPPNDAKLSKGDSVKILGQFKKLGIRINDFMDRLITNERKGPLVRSFTINDFGESIKAFNKDAQKKKIIELFKALDTEANGTIDSSELLKLWLRGKELTDSEDVLYRLLYRHLRETQFPEPLQKFQVLGISQDKTITDEMFANVFKELDLTEEELNYIMATYQLGNKKVKQFSELLKADGKPKSAKSFVKMEKKVYEEFKALLQKINGKRNGNKKFRKLMRLETGQKSSEEEYWETIFTDEWACWEYCLEAAYKLETFWRDPEFGPTPSDPAGMRSIVGNESNPPPGLPDESEIGWAIFEEILAKQKSKDQVTFMEGRQISPNDVVQGKLGDCWFVSSLSIIANNDEYVKGKPVEQCRKSQELSTYGVNPYLFKFFTKYGIYVFKYFKRFKPVYVVVDQLFPIQKSVNELIFAKSPDLGQQWVAFLQKSYAKLHHTYSNMISGDIAQGLNDLTNSLPIKQAIQEGKPQNEEKIRRLNNEQQMMGCSITAPKGAKVEAPVTLDDEKCGLFYSHAYSILEFIDLKVKKETYSLIRVRNPWGHGEWILDWSEKPKDNNDEYKSLQRNANELKKYYEEMGKKKSKIIPYDMNRDDGEFLMKFQDFNKVYTNLFTGYTLSNSYRCLTLTQSWNSEYPSGICSLQKSTAQDRKQFVKNNHQYLLTVKKDDTDVLMYIIQEDGRLYRGEKYPYKELCNGTLILAFELDEKEKALEEFSMEKSIIKNLKFELRRETNLWYKFKAGRYAIIPCKMKNDIVQSEFEFRIYYDKDIQIEKVKGRNNKFDELKKFETKDVDKANYDAFLTLLEKYKK